MSTQESFMATVSAGSNDNYRKIRLRDKHELLGDEPDWLPGELGGQDDHPSPVDYLLASLASCQVSVLQQCLEKNGVEEFEIDCKAEVSGFKKADELPDEMPANTALRIDHIDLKIVLKVLSEYEGTAEDCLLVYDEGCVVGQSLEGGIDYTPLVALETYN